MGFGGINVHLVLDRRVTDLPMAAAVGSPVQFVFDRTVSAGASSAQCLSISLSAADAYIGLRPPELLSMFTEAIGDLYTSSLIALGLILFVITFIVLAAARYLLLQIERRIG